MSKFENPDFDKRQLELRFDGEEICIYGTKTGIERLAALCLDLVKKGDASPSEHIHFDDFQILTPSSKRCVIAVFQSGK